ncbi:MAG: hypothetical protein ACXVRH_06665 [Thermoleophilaceae bacterium]
MRPRTLLAAGAGVIAFAAPAVAAAGGAHDGGFSGTTSQRDASGAPHAVSFRLAGHGRALARFHLSWDARCDNGQTLSSSTDVARIALTRQGSFRTVGAYSAAFPDGSGYSAQVSAQLSGHLRRDGRVGGLLSLKATVSDALGGAVASCSVGPIGYSAKRSSR